MWGGDGWWGTHPTGHCWGSSGNIIVVPLIIIIVTVVIIVVGHCWGSSGDFHCCHGHHHYEWSSSLGGIVEGAQVIFFSSPESKFYHHHCHYDHNHWEWTSGENNIPHYDHYDPQLVCVEPFEADAEGTLASSSFNDIILPLIIIMITISWFAWSHLKLRRRAPCQQELVIDFLFFFLQTRSPLSVTICYPLSSLSNQVSYFHCHRHSNQVPLVTHFQFVILIRHTRWAIFIVIVTHCHPRPHP